jgi:hypothetical protein
VSGAQGLRPASSAAFWSIQATAWLQRSLISPADIAKAQHTTARQQLAHELSQNLAVVAGRCCLLRTSSTAIAQVTAAAREKLLAAVVLPAVPQAL